jgi:hypothetical protein
MRRFLIATGVSLGVWVLIVGTSPVRLAADEDNNKINIVDECAPDPGWAPTGGCNLRGGTVSFAEFGSFLIIPNIRAVVGHPAWRMAPSYLTLEQGKRLKVRNVGGRIHTFTPVAEFGAGRVPNPGLNFGLDMVAPECPASTDIAPGRGVTVSGLGLGNQKFMCCIHPWMRAVVKVVPKD